MLNISPNFGVVSGPEIDSTYNYRFQTPSMMDGVRSDAESTTADDKLEALYLDTGIGLPTCYQCQLRQTAGSASSRQVQTQSGIGPVLAGA